MLYCVFLIWNTSQALQNWFAASEWGLVCCFRVTIFPVFHCNYIGEKHDGTLTIEVFDELLSTVKIASLTLHNLQRNHKLLIVLLHNFCRNLGVVLVYLPFHLNSFLLLVLPQSIFVYLYKNELIQHFKYKYQYSIVTSVDAIFHFHLSRCTFLWSYI